jgi:site-specific DNA-methyltransferase (adenine-specific)
MWIYGTGFPKSHDVSKGIDREAGAERTEIIAERKGVTKTFNIGATETVKARDPITAPATDAARQWQGWGTALKPAFEPIVLARKPISENTVSANVLKWGTGAINVDGCRVGTEDSTKRTNRAANSFMSGDIGTVQVLGETYQTGSDLGRWPANVCHDGSDEVVGMFPNAGGGSSGKPQFTRGIGGADKVLGGSERSGVAMVQTYADSGSAAAPAANTRPSSRLPSCNGCAG